MGRALIAAVWAGAIAWSSSGIAMSAPLEAYGGLPTLEEVAISPDGDKLAFITSVHDERTMLVKSLSTGKLLGGVKAGSQKLRDLAWADPDHVLLTMSRTTVSEEGAEARQEWWMAESYELSSRKQRELPGLADTDYLVMNMVSGAPEARQVGGHTSAFVTGWYFPMMEGQAALFSVDLATGRSKLVEKGSSTSQDWIVDDKGVAVAETDYDEGRKRWSVKLKRNDAWKEVYGVDAPIDTPEVDGITADGSTLVIRSKSSDHPTLTRLRLSDGVVSPPADDDFLDSPIIDPVTHRIIGYSSVTTRTEYQFLDPKDQDVWDKIERAFPDENLELESWTDDRRKIILRVYGPLDGFTYRLVDLKTGHADALGDVYDSIGADDLAPVKAITYKAADGRSIPAMLTLPKGKEAKNLPLVVLPHGGPADRDDPEFDWWSQALASKGYAVLQPQFRGSNGYGWEFLAAGFGQWGRKMQTDLSDGVRDLARQGTINPKRVCIVGASYGGYAALAGVALDTGVYRCAVSVAGLSDLHRFLAWKRSLKGGASKSGVRYWDRYMGSTGPEDPSLDAISPVKHADKVSIPVLLIHGKDDTTVPFEQSQLMADALKRAGKPVEFVPLNGEDHYLSRSQTRLQMLQATVKFLETNNPPG